MSDNTISSTSAVQKADLSNNLFLYEHVYVLRGDLSTQQIETLNNKYKELIETQGGKVSKVEYWGLKNLAYKIKKQKKAHYTLLNFIASKDIIKELERQLYVNEGVLRYITIKVEYLDAEPSIMTKNTQERYQRTENTKDTNEYSKNNTRDTGTQNQRITGTNVSSTELIKE